MKKIPLTHGHYALVDDEDYDELMKYSWNARYNKSNRSFYACGKYRSKNSTIHMHRIIMDCVKGMVVDHINHDTLDNRKTNLRICTQGQNLMNMQIGPKNKSGYKGVSWDKVNMKWKAQISVDNKNRSIGRFIDILDAARAYNKAALIHYGEYAFLNEIKV